MRTIIIRMVKVPSNKLMAVKALKDITGLGLKDSKDLFEGMVLDFNSGFKSGREISIYDQNISKLERELNEGNPGCFNTNSGQWERNNKILSLGIGDKSDYIDAISEYLMYNKTSDEIKVFITEVLSIIDKEKIEEIYNKLITNK